MTDPKDTSSQSSPEYPAALDTPVEGAVESDAAEDSSVNSEETPAEPVKPFATNTHDAAPVHKRGGKGNGGGGHSILLWLVLVLLVLMMGGVAGGAYKARQMYLALERDLAASTSARDKQQQGLASLKGQLEQGEEQQMALSQRQGDLQKAIGTVREQTQAAITEQQQLLANMGERLDGQQARINSMSSTSREDWLLAEAEYLLRLANQRVLLERNAHNAIALLQTADGIIKQVAAGMGDPELFAIRQTLGRELTQLKLVNSVDKEGTYAQLQALADEVDTLPRLGANHLQASSEEDLLELKDEDYHKPWYAKFWDVIKDSAGVLDQYIKIDNSEGPIKPLLNQNEALIVAANTRLFIQQAQLALLREEPKIYQQSLQEAQQLVEKHFVVSREREQYVQQLQQFAEQDIAPPMPDISESLRLLHGFVEKLHKLEG